MGNTLTTSGGEESTMGRSQKSGRTDHKSTSSSGANSAENSRMLFLLYLIHRTWNVVVDSVDHKNKRSRSSRSTSEDSGAPRSFFEDGYDTDINFSDTDHSSFGGSQYSFCSCSYCMEPKRNPLFGAGSLTFSICESESSSCLDYQMAPSGGKAPQEHPPASSRYSHEFTASTEWPSVTQIKENQRPPVYNPEDYVVSLRKYGRRANGGGNNGGKSIYDTSEDDRCADELRAATLPAKKCAKSKNPIPQPPESDCEMSLRQFGSVTDLLTKLRADLRAAFPSFVQEFVSAPLDGVSLLLEVLRAIQLSQSSNGTLTNAAMTTQRNSQTYQRRALLDELACLQCLNICCTRCPEAGPRLGGSTVGLLPLAASATGQGIRSRIISLQLLANACDKNQLGPGSQNIVLSGHSAVSEAFSALRFRCGEPVRFRLLVGMLNSSGGSGELQAFGLKFVNTFLDSVDSIQSRLYLQAELTQAGFDPETMTETIAVTSPDSQWLDRLKVEVQHFAEHKIDVEKLQVQARDAERVGSQMVILERRVQILQEEKTVLTSMERRLQERCAELQREIFRLQGAQHERFKGIDKRPVALPRQVPPLSKDGSIILQVPSEHEDEGISSSETGQSLSPEPPPLVLPQNICQKFSIRLNDKKQTDPKEEDEATIEDVIEELQNIVSDAEREISIQNFSCTQAINNPSRSSCASGETTPPLQQEREIVPVNLLPQPPRKSRSLARLMSNASDMDGSDYGMLLIQNGDEKLAFFDGADMETEKLNSYGEEEDVIINTMSSTNREILNVIMDAREKDEELAKLAAQSTKSQSVHKTPHQVPTQQFNGVFFMSEMNRRVPNLPDLAAALEARRVTKNLDRMEAYGLDSMVDIVMTSDKQNHTQQIYLKSKTTTPPFKIRTGHLNAGRYTSAATPREASRTNGAKVTDLASGLY